MTILGEVNGSPVRILVSLGIYWMDD